MGDYKNQRTKLPLDHWLPAVTSCRTNNTGRQKYDFEGRANFGEERMNEKEVEAIDGNMGKADSERNRKEK